MNLGIFVFALFIRVGIADLLEGARCLMKDGTTLGTCVKTFNCAFIVHQIQSGAIRQNPATICSHSQRTVCCPFVPKPPPVIEQQLNTTILSPPQRISERKCIEYGSIVNQTVRINSVIPGDPPVDKIIDKCKHKAVQLIVGGTDANIGEFPHQALLGYNNGDSNEWGCGGSLVSERFVITAAHCLYPRGYGAVKFAKLGANSRSQNDPHTIVYDIMEIFQHPNYNRKTYDEDLGLLKLNENVSFSEFVTPICLPSKFNDANKAVVSGFGRTGFQQSSSENLLKVVIEKFTHEECQQTYGNVITVNNVTMLCYGHHTEKKDSCSGDSGGPLQIYNDKQAYCTYALIGVVSFGMKQCGMEGKPGVYVNVHHYLNWIEGIVWNN